MRQINPDFSIRRYPTKKEEMFNFITILRNKHSSGADAIKKVILKSIAYAITRKLVQLINCSLVTKVFSEQLAVTKVNPLNEKRSTAE